MMDPTTVDSQWIAYAGRYGVPSFLAVVLYWAAPKVWKFVSNRLGVMQSQNDLTQASIGGVTDVVTTLRTQITDLTKQFNDVEGKLKEMSTTLDKAIQDKVLAEREAAKAKSDLFILQLYVDRLRAQIHSLGAQPVERKTDTSAPTDQRG